MTLSTTPLFDVLKDFDQFPYTRLVGGKEIPLTVKDAILQACSKMILNPHTRLDVHDEQKFKLFQLCEQLKTTQPQETIELSFDDAKLLSERCRMYYTADIFGYIHLYLDGKKTEQ